MTFGQSHVSSGVRFSDSSFVFEYPTPASEAYDPTKTPEETTAETTTEPNLEETTTAAATTELEADVITAAEEEESLDINVNIGEGTPEAEITMNEDQLIETVLSEEEKELFKDGTVGVDLNIDNANKTIIDTIKKAVEDYLVDFQDSSYNWSLYIDISLFKTLNGEK